MEKETAYRDLCKDVKAYYSTPRIYHYGKKDISLGWNLDCHEINLWTYWQGRGHLNSSILLVGQDWGSPADNPAIMNTIQQINLGKHLLYMDHHTSSPTDTNLVELFAELGYSINKDDIHNEDLFFTNLILGYRDKGTSGGYQPKWLTPGDQEFFRRLVSILRPKVILCLGRSTFEGVTKSLKTDYTKYKSFKDQIAASAVHTQFDDLPLTIFPLAHCGTMGTLNRNRGCNDPLLSRDPLRPQKQDWSHIKDYL